MLLQKVQQIYARLINMISLPVCILLTNHETLYDLNIVLSFHPFFWANHLPFYNYNRYVANTKSFLNRLNKANIFP